MAKIQQKLREGAYQVSSKDYQSALKMVHQFVCECEETYAQHLVSIILTGSLARGSYQPGLSDVDVITVLRDSSPDDVRVGLSHLYNRLSGEYNIQFDPITFEHQDILPPWDDDLCIQPEIFRMKASGKVLCGENIIDNLPTPTKRQMWEFERSFKKWFKESDQSNWQDWTLKNCLKAILGQATLYFYYKTGIFEFSKDHIADLFADHLPHFPHQSSIMLASYLWRHYPESVDETLRLRMAEQARRFVNYVNLSLGFGREYLIG